MSAYESFNQSGVAKFINSQAGRVARLVVGLALLAVGYALRGGALGVVLMVLSLLPLSGAAFDLCFVSALLGGPISGARIRGRKTN